MTEGEGVEEEQTLDTDRDQAAPDQGEGEEQHQDWVVDMEEAEAEGVRCEPQQVLTTPPHMPGQESPHLLSSPLEAAVEVHVEEADLEAHGGGLVGQKR